MDEGWVRESWDLISEPLPVSRKLSGMKFAAKMKQVFYGQPGETMNPREKSCHVQLLNRSNRGVCVRERMCVTVYLYSGILSQTWWLFPVEENEVMAKLEGLQQLFYSAYEFEIRATGRALLDHKRNDRRWK